jgi:pilus assembly protein TadC
VSGGTVHGLGAAGAALAATVAAIGGRRRKGGLWRLRVALGMPRARRQPLRAPGRWGDRAREWGPVAVTGFAVAVLAGGLTGSAAGLAAAFGARRWLRARRDAAPAPGTDAGPDPAVLPLCADLMAACLAAGATPGEAAGAVGRCLGGPLGAALIRVRAETRLGADPADCWERFGTLPGARGMGRCLARAATTGSAQVAEMSRLAADHRAAQARAALAGARRAAVLATAPLGACFLPAFLLVGVAPVVMGLAGAVLGGPTT